MARHSYGHAVEGTRVSDANVERTRQNRGRTKPGITATYRIVSGAICVVTGFAMRLAAKTINDPSFTPETASNFLPALLFAFLYHVVVFGGMFIAIIFYKRYPRFAWIIFANFFGYTWASISIRSGGFFGL